MYLHNQTQQCIYFFPQWLLVSSITAIIRPILYKTFKKGWLHIVRTHYMCAGAWGGVVVKALPF